MEKFSGLIVSSARTLERNASSEIFYLLTEILGLEDVKSAPIKGISGLSLVSFLEDPIEIIKRIKKELDADPTVLQYVLKLVPIQYKTSSSLDKYVEISSFLGEQISENIKWRINLRRRHTQLERSEIIHEIASKISKGEVSLDNAELFIIVEIIGKNTYFAISDIAELATVSYHIDEDKDDFTF